MPMFDYKCPSCGHTHEALRKHSDPAPACPKCGEDTERQVSKPAEPRFEGSGFYATDFAHK